MEHGPPITWIVWACVLPLAGLSVGGVILLFRRQTSWGYCALAFAFYAFVFLGFALPQLAKARN